MAAATGRKKGKDAQEAAIDLESPNKKPKVSVENEQETASGVQETASGVREKKVTASGVFSTQEAAASVGLRLTQPPRPVAPVEREIIQGSAKPLHGFIKELWASVTWRLSKYLYEHATVQLRKPLWKLDTPQFVKGQPGAPTSFKEPWVIFGDMEWGVLLEDPQDQTWRDTVPWPVVRPCSLGIAGPSVVHAQALGF